MAEVRWLNSTGMKMTHFVSQTSGEVGRERQGAYGVEITCAAEETADCTAWAITYLIEGQYSN